MKQRFEVETAGTETETPNLISYVAALLYLLKASGIHISNNDLLVIYFRFILIGLRKAKFLIRS